MNNTKRTGNDDNNAVDGFERVVGSSTTPINAITKPVDGALKSVDSSTALFDSASE